MLELGIKAPDFELPDQNGEVHKLSDYLGKNIIAFSFFRFKSSYIVSNPCVSRLPRCYEKEKAL